VTRNYSDERVSIGRMRKQLERGKKAGRNQERLSNVCAP
jgi:hypothetical protein